MKKTLITLENVQSLYPKDKEGRSFELIKKRKVRGNNKKPLYQLLETLTIQLSNGIIIVIPKSFIWDLSSVPRVIWWIFSPDGDFALAYLIHDYLWLNKKEMEALFWKHGLHFDQKTTDDEMLLWAKVTNGTSKRSFRNFDNKARYYGVRLFGWLVWNGHIKITKPVKNK